MPAAMLACFELQSNSHEIPKFHLVIYSNISNLIRDLNFELMFLINLYVFVRFEPSKRRFLVQQHVIFVPWHLVPAPTGKILGSCHRSQPSNGLKHPTTTTTNNHNHNHNHKQQPQPNGLPFLLTIHQLSTTKRLETPRF